MPFSLAVIPIRGDRIEVTRRCLAAITPQVDRVLLIDNSDHGTVATDLGRLDPTALVLEDNQQPPNLSRLWNLGLTAAREMAGTPHHFVAVLNDDAIVGPTWFEDVVRSMRRYNCAAGGVSDAGFHIHQAPGTTLIHRRMPGYAFVLDGRANLMADEQFQWWCGDNDLDMQARRAGGTVLIPGTVEHLFPDQSTRGVLAERAAVDMQLFVEKWGFRPW